MAARDLQDMDVDEADHTILGLLSEGRCTQGYIGDQTDVLRYKVHERLKLYGVAGYTQTIHESTALWELVGDSRDEDNE